MINEISSSDVEVVIQDKDRVGAEEILQENQNRNSSEINIQYKGKELLRDVVELLSSSALGAGVGYLAGGMIKVIVDLAKNGITEVQKKSQEEGLQENTSRYIGINDYSVSGLSLGAMAGVITYLCVSELIKQRKEREAELRAVRDNVAENDNFNGALERQEVITNHQGRGEIANGVANGDDQMIVVGAEITVNGDTRNDLKYNPRSMMAVGEGNLNDVNAVPIFQSRQSRKGSVAPLPEEKELQSDEFEKKLAEIKENSKRLEDEESRREENLERRSQPGKSIQNSLSDERRLKIEGAKEFIKTGGYNLYKESPNLVFVRRDQEHKKQIEETTKQEDDGAGVFSVRRSQSPSPSIEQDRSISAPNPEPEIPSAYASALQSLKSPRDSVRSSQAMETHGDLAELQRTKPFFQAVQVFKEKKMLTTEVGSPVK